jgi:hypothetical protein
MRTLVVAFVALSLASASQKSSGEPQSSASFAEDAAEAQADREFESQLDAYETQLFAQHYAEALAIAQNLKPPAGGTASQAFVAALQASALLGLKRETEAARLIAQSEQLAPNDPNPSRSLFIGGLITERSDVAADAFDRLIARAPDVVRELDVKTVRYFLNHEPKGAEKRNEDRRIALAQIGYGGDTEIGHWRAADAVDILVKRGDFSGAGELLQYVKEPGALENMLIQKRYSALWPRLEKLAGPHLANVKESSVGAAERAYRAEPDDHEKLQRYVNALRHAGRFSDAIALKSRLPSTRDAMASADEQTGWAVNNVAFALYQAGRADDADQLLALLNEAPMANGSWRISMIINRLEILVLGGKFDKAANLLDVTERSAKSDGSPYAQQLVRRLRYCTLSSLGRHDEAAKALPEMLKHADDALDATIGGLLCDGNFEKAEELALAGLKNPDEKKRLSFEEDFVHALQSAR